MNNKQRWYLANKEKINIRNKERYRLNPMTQAIRNAKMKAKRRSLPFDIKAEDLVIPAVCPVLEIPLTLSNGKHTWNSPSIDRIVPELGYVKGNVRVISLRANLLKSDIKLEECKLILKDIENICEQQNS